MILQPVVEPMDCFTALHVTYPHARRQYHGQTRGLVLQEVFRRVEPRQRSIGQFLRAEVTTPLGLDIHLGMEAELQARANIADMVSLSPEEVTLALSCSVTSIHWQMHPPGRGGCSGGGQGGHPPAAGEVPEARQGDGGAEAGPEVAVDMHARHRDGAGLQGEVGG